MTQERLFTLAPEALVLNAFYEPGSGWRLAVRMRRQGDPWDDAEQADYARLTSEELADVISIEAIQRLLGS